MSTNRRRCPLHPDGCTKHPNPTPPRHVRRWRRPQPPLRGSIATHVEIRHGGRRPGIRWPRNVWESA